MSKILDVNQSYTFSQIFELKIEPDDLAAEFGYTFQRTRLNMPPVSLIRNVRVLNGSHYQIKSGKDSFSLPANMQYRFSK